MSDLLGFLIDLCLIGFFGTLAVIALAIPVSVLCAIAFLTIEKTRETLDRRRQTILKEAEAMAAEVEAASADIRSGARHSRQAPKNLNEVP
mgnify:CR=1 FL=1